LDIYSTISPKNSRNPATCEQHTKLAEFADIPTKPASAPPSILSMLSILSIECCPLTAACRLLMQNAETP
jgi:hypothetical protein